MNDAKGVRKAQPAQKLIEKVLEVRISQRLRRLNDLVQVRVIQLHGDVQRVVREVHDNVLEADDVGVLSEPAAQANLAQCVLAIRGCR